MEINLFDESIILENIDKIANHADAVIVGLENEHVMRSTMRKYAVTEELATLIKTLRAQDKISSKALASHIKRSPSYVSKLERGNVKSIQGEDLTKILDFIVPGKDFFQDKLPTIIRTLESFQMPGRMSRQVWLLDYDLIKRPIEVPASLVEDAQARMSAHHLDTRGLTRIINANRDSDISAEFPSNEVISYTLKDKNFLFIRVELDEKKLADLISGKNRVTDYSTINAIAYALVRMENHRNDEEIDAQAAQAVLRGCDAYLSRFGIHSYTDYMHLLLTESSYIEEGSDLSRMFSSSNTESLSNILEHFNQASAHDLPVTTQALDAFSANLDWDTAFMLKIVGQPFHEFEKASFSMKRQLLDDIGKIIEKYAEMPEYEQSIERY